MLGHCLLYFMNVWVMQGVNFQKITTRRFNPTAVLEWKAVSFLKLIVYVLCTTWAWQIYSFFKSATPWQVVWYTIWLWAAVSNLDSPLHLEQQSRISLTSLLKCLFWWHLQVQCFSITALQIYSLYKDRQVIYPLMFNFQSLTVHGKKCSMTELYSQLLLSVFMAYNVHNYTIS